MTPHERMRVREQLAQLDREHLEAQEGLRTIRLAVDDVTATLGRISRTRYQLAKALDRGRSGDTRGSIFRKCVLTHHANNIDRPRSPRLARSSDR